MSDEPLVTGSMKYSRFNGATFGVIVAVSKCFSRQNKSICKATWATRAARAVLTFL